jgi:hypothetical protein
LARPREKGFPVARPAKTGAQNEEWFKGAAILPRQEYLKSNHQGRRTGSGRRQQSMKQGNV